MAAENRQRAGVLKKQEKYERQKRQNKKANEDRLKTSIPPRTKKAHDPSQTHFKRHCKTKRSSQRRETRQLIHNHGKRSCTGSNPCRTRKQQSRRGTGHTKRRTPKQNSPPPGHIKHMSTARSCPNRNARPGDTPRCRGYDRQSEHPRRRHSRNIPRPNTVGGRGGRKHKRQQRTLRRNRT